MFFKAFKSLPPIPQPRDPASNQAEAEEEVKEAGAFAAEPVDKGHGSAGLEVPVPVEEGGEDGETSEGDKQE